MHVVVGLGTLLGLDDRPGEVAGWGPVPASVARALVARQQRCEWRFGVHDDDGWLTFDGLTRRRAMPVGTWSADEGGPAQPRVDGVVELHVPASWVPSDRPAVSVGADGRWADVLADIARQVGLDAPIGQDPRARFPGRPLRRRTQTVFRCCLFPGCRRPARDCETDHLRDWSKGGPTAEQNLEPECRHDHRNKTDFGWRLVRTGERTFCWISPYGRRHHVCAPRLVEPALTPLTIASTPGDSATAADHFDEPSLWAHDPGDRLVGAAVERSELRAGRPQDSVDDDEPPPF